MRFCKKIAKAFSIVLLIVLFSVSVFSLSQQPLVVRVGYWPSYGITQDRNGNLSGYAYDYMQEIAHLNNWKLEFIPCEWTNALDMLRDGQLDLFGPLERTPQRELIYDYPEYSMGEECGVIYTRDSNNEIYFQNPQSLNGKKLGSMGDNYFDAELEQYCSDNEIEFQKIIIDDAQKLDKALQNGEIDMRMAGSLQIPDDVKIVLRLTNENFFYPTTKGNTRVLEGMNKALNTIQTTNPFYNLHLYEKYYTSRAAEKQAFTIQEAKFIDNAPIIRIAYDKYDQPIEYYDEQTHTAKGISIDLLKAVEKYSGLQFEFVPTYDMNEVHQLIKNNEVQIVSGLVEDEHFNSMYGLKPSNPLMENTLAFIAKQGASFYMSRTTLAVPKNWIGIRHHMEMAYPDMSIQIYDSTDECLKAVKNGQADLTVLNTLTAEKSLKAYYYRELTANSMTHGNISICLGVADNADPLLLDVINKSIASIDDHTREQIIYQYTISIPYSPPLSEIIRYNIPVIFIGALIFLAILYLFSLQSRKKLNALAFYDPLTGEMNLNKFELETKKRLSRKDKTYALMVIDIDKFKSINDLYGYAFGDQLLVTVARALHKTILPGTILCRGTADKFYMFFEFIDSDWLSKRFELISNNVLNAVTQNMPSCNIILSSGVCVIREDTDTIISIVDRANIASKQVKSYHESCFTFYDQSMYDRLNQMRTIENSMSDSLKKKEFLVYLQPKIDLHTGKIGGAEALVRWQHPEKGIVPPSEFIPLFEENGFIVNLDFYMLEQVCITLERWKKEGRELFPISVNLSRRHLFHVDTARLLHDIVAKYDVEPSLIEVELTESAFDNCDIATINALFDTLHTNGFTVSVDDFGAGYSSLSLLKDLAIDVLKIDKSFFDCNPGCGMSKMSILLESVITLSRNLNIKTVSEGVENKQQVELLTKLGCDLVQGFYFARPMPISQLELKLDSSNIFIGETVV